MARRHGRAVRPGARPARVYQPCQPVTARPGARRAHGDARGGMEGSLTRVRLEQTGICEPRLAPISTILTFRRSEMSMTSSKIGSGIVAAAAIGVALLV